MADYSKEMNNISVRSHLIRIIITTFLIMSVCYFLDIPVSHSIFLTIMGWMIGWHVIGSFHKTLSEYALKNALAYVILYFLFIFGKYFLNLY